MKQRKYFELFASVGRKCIPRKEFPYTADSLLADMKYARIHGAAVLSNVAESYSYVYGNQETIQLARENSRLVSLAAVPATAILESGDAYYYDKLLDHGAKGFVAFGKGPLHSSLHPKNMKPMVEALIAHKRPLIIASATTEEVLRQISSLAEAYPQLPIIMQGTSWSIGRLFCEVMERHDNLHFEISSNHINGILEIAKKFFGIERALFGTEWPNKSMGAMKALVEYADITEEEKNLVAYGNACRLLGLAEEAFPLYEDAECELDEIALEADAGLPISVPVIDSHTHMVSSEDRIVSYSIMPQSDCDSMVKKMERLGIDAILTAPWSGITIDGHKGNEESLYAARKYPGKIYAYSTCNAHYEEDLQTWKKYHTEYPEYFVGVKPYWPNQKLNLTDQVYEPWFSYANAHHLPLLLHSGGTDAILEQADILSLRYPDITFILAHTGINYEVARKHVALAKARENVILEITYTSTTRGMIEFLVEQVGADRVLYGSDSPIRDPAPQLGWVCYAKIPLEDKKKILAGNIQRILSNKLGSK